MKVCTTCNNYYANCRCSPEHKEIVSIDDDIAPVILAFNDAFRLLGLRQTKTLFSCAGHICREYNDAPVDSSTPQFYILFYSNDEQLDLKEFFMDALNLRMPKGVLLEVYRRGNEVYIGIISKKHVGELSLKGMASFLKAKAIFFGYLTSKLEELNLQSTR